MKRFTIALTLALVAGACKTAPPAPVRPPAPSFDEKTSWILRLEDQRILRDESVQAIDLTRLLTDSEARVRRRAALAVGRVGLRDGTAPLIALLQDPEVEVRQMAAFALGLIADRSASEALVAALADSSPLVTGSAAEALGLIGDAAAAPAIGRMLSAIVASGTVNDPPPDQETSRDTPAAAFRLGITALVRLKAYDALAAAVLDAAGQPRVRYWPVAFGLQRLEDKRALPALITLAGDAHAYTQAFAAKGLGAMQDRRAGVALLPLVASPERSVAIEAVRSLGRLGEPGAGAALLAIIRAPASDPQLRLEAVTALGSTGGSGATEMLIDLMGDKSSEMRAASLRSFARLDAESFVTVLSGLDLDDDWRVRAALASVLGTLTPEAGGPRLRAMLQDPEPRVVPAVLDAMVALALPDAAPALLDRLKAGDPVIRAAAARGLGKLKPAGGAAALTEAFTRGAGDTTYLARAAALSALAAYGAADATPVLTQALADPDWAVRVKAAQLLTVIDPASDAMRRIRPAPPLAPERYQAGRLVNPPVSTQAFIVTDRGEIGIELAVLDAPQTVENFVKLARDGFFTGIVIHRVVPDFVVQAGDPRGDGEGGPAYDIRDELNQRLYQRGTVGMALDWQDTGGSQFFITHSPQPHLDARYTVFGRVVSGMDVVDRIQQGDVIRGVRVWDGTTPQ